jgi:hypothetical protein
VGSDHPRKAENVGVDFPLALGVDGMCAPVAHTGMTVAVGGQTGVGRLSASAATSQHGVYG